MKKTLVLGVVVALACSIAAAAQAFRLEAPAQSDFQLGEKENDTYFAREIWFTPEGYEMVSYGTASYAGRVELVINGRVVDVASPQRTRPKRNAVDGAVAWKTPPYLWTSLGATLTKVGTYSIFTRYCANKACESFPLASDTEGRAFEVRPVIWAYDQCALGDAVRLAFWVAYFDKAPHDLGSVAIEEYPPEGFGEVLPARSESRESSVVSTIEIARADYDAWAASPVTLRFVSDSDVTPTYESFAPDPDYLEPCTE